MALAHASWLHGHAVEIEFEDRIASVWRAGFYCRIQGRPGTDNWLHFAIPTPVIVNTRRLKAGSVMLRFRAAGAASVHAVHVFDGEDKVANHNGLNVKPTAWGMERFDVPGDPEVRWGIGISLGVRFPGEGDRLEFAAAGCDFLGESAAVRVRRPGS